MVRPDLAGPDSGPESPFPISLSGRVIAGFGRGGKKVERPFSLDTNPWGLVCLSLLFPLDARLFFQDVARP